MDIRCEKLEYENEQLRRKLSQTTEERDRAMSNCHELWKRLNGLINLAANSASTSYTLSSGLPTSPSDSYDSANSRSKSTSPNSSAASLNDSLLSSTTTTTTTTTTNQQLSNKQAPPTNNNNSFNNNLINSQHKNHSPIKSNNNSPMKANIRSSNSPNNASAQSLPINLKRPIEAINSPSSYYDALKPLSKSSSAASLLPDKNNNHPLIVEVPKELHQTVGEIVEIAPGQFKCRYCEKTFDRIFSVHRHERVHTGYKPCKCNECGRGFSEKRNLRHHIIRFHSDGSGRELLKRNRNKTGNSASKQQQFQANLMGNGSGNLSQLQTSNALDVAKNALHEAHKLRQQMSHQMNQNNVISNQTLVNQMANGNDHNSNNVLKYYSTCTSNSTNDDGEEDDDDEEEDEDEPMTTEDEYKALYKHLASLPDIDTSGLKALGAAAAVITVNSSSSRRRKSKPSKKIIPDKR